MLPRGPQGIPRPHYNPFQTVQQESPVRNDFGRTQANNLVPHNPFLSIQPTQQPIITQSVSKITQPP